MFRPTGIRRAERLVLGHHAAGGPVLAACGGIAEGWWAMIIQWLGVWAPAGAAFGSGILAIVALALLWEWWAQRKRGKDAVEQLRGFAAQSGTDPASETLIRSAKIVDARWIRPLAARVPHLRDLANTLEQAGVRWSPQTYLLITLGAAVVLGSGRSRPSGSARRGRRWGWLPYLYLQEKDALHPGLR
jgi:hypothetical protein